MIREIGRELQSRLRAKGCPFVVVDGPEDKKPATFARERIVIEHDEGGRDSFGPAKKNHVNPTQSLTRTLSGKLTIYAQDPTAGALPFEHRRRAEHVLDLVLCAMDYVARLRHNAWTPTGGRFIPTPTLGASDRIGGAVYELTFSFDRGVYDRTWSGAARPEAALGPDGVPVTTTDEITFFNGPTGQVPETAC